MALVEGLLPLFLIPSQPYLSLSTLGRFEAHHAPLCNLLDGREDCATHFSSHIPSEGTGSPNQKKALSYGLFPAQAVPVRVKMDPGSPSTALLSLPHHLALTEL